MKRNVFKKLLALTLALCMCLSLAAPAGASWWDLWSTLTDDSASVADDTSTDTSSESQPFVSGTEGSTNFRIPAIVTLDDGTIVAAADARWNYNADYGGIDTLVAYSTNSGANWDHSWGARFDDNNKVFSSTSCTIMDPSLATDGKTVYMLLDLFPAGYSNVQKNCLTGNGFDKAGHLKLRAGASGEISSTNESEYFYYLGAFSTEVDESEQRANIYQNDNPDPIASYTVDRWFNLYQDGVKVSNLFYKGATYQVYPAQYLYFVKSTDGGKTWSAPDLLNLKQDNAEVFFGACPGGGYVTSTGRIVFPCYSADTLGTQYLQTSVIYSDNGVEWTRSDDMGSVGTTSESTVSEVTLNGQNYLYLFTRSNHVDKADGSDHSVREYYVSDDNGATWAKKGDFPANITYGEKSALGSITYSQQIDGCPAIILSAPTSTSHTTGVIYVGLVQSDGSINWKYSKTINSSYFKYSDLAELSGGSIGLLYESSNSGNNVSGITFEVFDIATLAPGATIGDGTTTDPDTGDNNGQTTETMKDAATGVSAQLPAGSILSVDGNQTVNALTEDTYVAYDIKINNGDYKGSAEVTLPVTGLNTSKGLYGFVVNEDNSITTVNDGQLSDDKTTYTFTAPHFSVVGVAEQPDTSDSSTATKTATVDLTVGDNGPVMVDGNATVSVDSNQYIATVETVYTAGTGEPAKIDSITSGQEYYICDGTNYLTVTQTTGWFGTTTTTTTTATSVNEAAKWMITAVDGGYKISTTYNSVDYYLYTTTNSSSSTLGVSADQDGFVWAYDNTDGFSKTYTYTSGTPWNSTTTTVYLGTSTNYSGASWGVSSSTTTKGYPYQETSTEGTTTITFTGTGEGRTTATVGDTTYTINVTAPTEYVDKNLSLNGELDLSGYSNIKITSETDIVSLSGTTIRAGSTTGKATVTYDKVNDGNKPTKHYLCTITVSDVIAATMENSPFVGGTSNVYNKDGATNVSTVAVSHGFPITKIHMTAGVTYDVDLASEYSDSSVEWSVADETVATVDQTGNLAAKSAGNTYLKATIDGVTYQVPVEVIDGTYDSTASSNNRIYHFYIGKTYNTDVYYSYNFSEPALTGEGEVFYYSVPKATSSNKDSIMMLDYFGAPKDGYALTGMQLVNLSNTGEYYLLHDNGVLNTSSDDYYWNMRNKDNYYTTWPYTEQVRAELNKAIELGCDGAQGFSYYYSSSNKSSTENIAFNVAGRLEFYSQKLPTMTKEIDSITKKGENSATPYTPGTEVEVGDTINYKITVTRYATIADYGTITYSGASLTDQLTQDQYYTAATGTQKATVDNMGTSDTTNKNYVYYTRLTLTEDNFGDVVKNGEIINEAEFSYTYQAQFSKGSMKESDTATAAIKISLSNYVVDFGLPVEIDLSSLFNSMGYSLTSAEVGDTKLTTTGNKITYTPSVTYDNIPVYVDLSVTKNDGNKALTYGIYIVPASNVLYEQNFLTQNTQTNRISWTESKATDLGNQQLSKVGSEGESNFGYDDIYKNINKADGYWTASGLNEVSSSTNKLSTSFYGNGFDLIGSCGPNTRCVMVSVVPVDGGKSQTAIIDTYYSKDTIHQVPLAHLMFDKETTYNVSIRAYGPLYGTHTTGVDGAYEDAESAIFADLAAMGIDEDDVEFISMNEVLGGDEAGVAVVDANSTSTNDSGDGYVQIDGFRVYRDSDHASYPSKEQNITYTNILDAVGSTITAYTESGEKTNIDVLEYEKSGGPQNEIYLASGDNRSVQIKLSGNNIPNTIQVSLRAVNGATQWNNTDISSTVEMYYDVTVVKSNGEAVATITNTGNNMLAIGNVKLPNTVTAEGPSAASTEALVYSLNVALMLVDYEVGGETEPVFQPDIQVKDSSVSLFSKKVVTLTVTTSTDVETLEINGKYLRPTNAWMVKMGWSDTYTYVYVDTVKKGTTKTYTIVASDINGNQYSYPYEA